MATYEKLCGLKTVDGFDGGDEHLTPPFLADLCLQGHIVNDLPVTNVIGTNDGATVRDYVSDVVIALGAAKRGNDGNWEQGYPTDILKKITTAFDLLPSSDTRSTVFDVPYVDNKGYEKNLVIVAVAGAAGALAVGLHTESIE